jgi:hypothetical protein
MKTKKFYCGLYFANILFIYDANNEQVQDHLNKKYDVQLDCNRSHCGGVWSIGEEEEKIYCIWVGNRDLSILVHEVFHLVMDIFSDRGVVTDDEHQEAFAYYMQYWVDILRRELSKKKKNKEA